MRMPLHRDSKWVGFRHTKALFEWHLWGFQQLETPQRLIELIPAISLEAILLRAGTLLALLRYAQSRHRHLGVQPLMGSSNANGALTWRKVLAFSSKHSHTLLLHTCATYSRCVHSQIQQESTLEISWNFEVHWIWWEIKWKYWN